MCPSWALWIKISPAISINKGCCSPQAISHCSHPWMCTLRGFRIEKSRTLAQDSSVQFSRSVMSDSLRPHGLQHPRLPCPSPTPGAYSNSCSLSQWCHLTISSAVVPSSAGTQLLSFNCCLLNCHLLLSVFASIRVFSNESALCIIRWPKYWSFSLSISTSNKYSVLISFMVDWFDLLVVQGTLKSIFQHHNLKASIDWNF